MKIYSSRFVPVMHALSDKQKERLPFQADFGVDERDMVAVSGYEFVFKNVFRLPWHSAVLRNLQKAQLILSREVSAN